MHKGWIPCSGPSKKGSKRGPKGVESQDPRGRDPGPPTRDMQFVTFNAHGFFGRMPISGPPPGGPSGPRPSTCQMGSPRTQGMGTPDP